MKLASHPAAANTWLITKASPGEVVLTAKWNRDCGLSSCFSMLGSLLYSLFEGSPQDQVKPAPNSLDIVVPDNDAMIQEWWQEIPKNLPPKKEGLDGFEDFWGTLSDISPDSNPTSPGSPGSSSQSEEDDAGVEAMAKRAEEYLKFWEKGAGAGGSP